MNTKIELLHGDITKLEVDAIVNSANTGLVGGMGIDGAIHDAAGQELYKACEKLEGCKVREAKVTPGFKLPAKYIIHTVGPMWFAGEKNEAEDLRNCYINCLKLAESLGVKSIAFPAISCGAFGYPVEKAVKETHKAVTGYLENSSNIEKVIFVLFDQGHYELYKKEFN